MQKNYEQRCKDLQKTIGEISDKLLKDDLIGILGENVTSSEFVVTRIEEIVRKYLVEDREK